MNYAIEIAEDARLAGEIRRIGKDRIASARKHLRKISDDMDNRIHEVRKDLKKLRALIRLVREPLGKSCYKEEDRTFRDAGRLLAPFRDAAARVALVKSLREKKTGSISDSALEIADKEVRSLYKKTVRKVEVTKAAREANELLKEAVERLKDWEPEETGFGLFRDGLRDMYENARIDLARCLIHPTAPNFHDWRKCCKYLRYQIDLLHLAHPQKLKKEEQALHGLTDLLGNHHDLAVLGETLEPLADGTLDDAELWAIHQAFDTEQRRLMKQCWSRGRRLFAETPEDFVKRFEAYWMGAREEK
jgi:CHAD domain-containing protein